MPHSYQSKRTIPNWLDGFLKMNEGMQPSKIFFEWTGISAIAAVLQRKCWVYVGRHINYPMLYIVLVGNSGCGKGTAIEPTYKILEALKVPMAADVEAGKAIYDSWKNTRKTTTFPNNPEIPDMVHCSLTAIAEEFTGFLEKNKFQSEFVTRLCLVYDTVKDSITDKSSANVRYIPGAFINILGGTTPSSLRETLPKNLIGGGLTARINFVYGERPQNPIIDDSATEEQKKLFDKLVIDLGYVYTLRGEFKWTPNAFNLYDKWRTERWKDPLKYGPQFEHYMDRCMVYGPRIAMCFAAARKDFNFTIEEKDFARTIDLISRTEIDMPKVFQLYGANPEYEVMKGIISTLKQHKKISFSAILTIHIRDAKEMDIRNMLQAIERMNICKRTIDNGTMESFYVYNNNREN